MSKPVRVLHVFGGLSLGGAESRMMDLYREMDEKKVQFDFLVHSSSYPQRTPEFYDEEIKKRGGRIYVLPKFRVYNYFAYRRAIRKFFREHHDFSMVQGHMTSTAAIYLPLAKRAGIKTVAAHARSAGVDPGIKGIVTKLLRLKLMKLADYCFACSKEAGTAVFGKGFADSPKARLIPNAVNAEQYRFSPELRGQLRRELGVEDNFVIGHVGRFHYAKNHEYLIRIFVELVKIAGDEGVDPVLLLIGAGEGMEQIREQVREARLEDKVIFTGNRSDVYEVYQAMDYFVFPSRFEGLPGTVIEAQAAGLRCLISDRITGETLITPLAQARSIEIPPVEWARVILAQKDYSRKDMLQEIREAGFDVVKQAEAMGHFYATGQFE